MYKAATWQYLPHNRVTEQRNELVRMIKIPGDLGWHAEYIIYLIISNLAVISYLLLAQTVYGVIPLDLL